MAMVVLPLPAVPSTTVCPYSGRYTTSRCRPWGTGNLMGADFLERCSNGFVLRYTISLSDLFKKEMSLAQPSDERGYQLSEYLPNPQHPQPCSSTMLEWCEAECPLLTRGAIVDQRMHKPEARGGLVMA